MSIIKKLIKSIPKAGWKAIVDAGKTSPLAAFGLTFLQTLQESIQEHPKEELLNAGKEVVQIPSLEIVNELRQLGIDPEKTDVTAAFFQAYFALILKWDGNPFPLEEVFEELQNLRNLPLALREELRKEFQSLSGRFDSLDEKLDRLPLLFDAALSENLSREEREFEEGYLTGVSTRYNKVVTLGVRDLREFNQKLSIAYVSLNIKTNTEDEEIARPAKEVLSRYPLLALK